ncbi:hypothetical protein EIL81_13620 [Photorhabdus laumondii subsp. laumondii]|nr:hypothetical protein [Photorhabdus laumondii subsp. laumondii]
MLPFMKKDVYSSINYSAIHYYQIVIILKTIILRVLYPMDFKMHRGGKGTNPREHRERYDRGE